MSQLKVDTIRHTGASSDAITLAADGTAAIGKCTAKVTNNLSNRNLIINGACQIAQRGTTATENSVGTVDRFRLEYTGINNHSDQAQVDVTSNDSGPFEKGFRKAFRVTNGDQNAGADAGDLSSTQYTIEAYDLASSGWLCTDPNSKLTFSFWVKSSVAGTFYGYLYIADGGGDSFSFSTGALSADTWKYVTVTIPGHADLAVNQDNGAGMTIYLQHYMGTDRTTSGHTLGAWQSWDSSNRTPDFSESTWWTTDNAQFETTGWQLEVGDVATDFEHRSYHTELLNCQRYFYNIKGDQYDSAGILGYALSSTELRLKVDFPVPMREMPTYVGNAWDCKFKANNTSGTLHWTNLSMINPNTVVNPSKTMMKCVTGSSLSVTAGECGDMEFHEDGGELTFSADL